MQNVKAKSAETDGSVILNEEALIAQTVRSYALSKYIFNHYNSNTPKSYYNHH